MTDNVAFLFKWAEISPQSRLGIGYIKGQNGGDMHLHRHAEDTNSYY